MCNCLTNSLNCIIIHNYLNRHFILSLQEMKEKTVTLWSPETQITYTISQNYWLAWRKHSQQYEILGLGLDFY